MTREHLRKLRRSEKKLKARARAREHARAPIVAPLKEVFALITPMTIAEEDFALSMISVARKNLAGKKIGAQ